MALFGNKEEIIETAIRLEERTKYLELTRAVDELLKYNQCSDEHYATMDIWHSAADEFRIKADHMENKDAAIRRVRQALKDLRK